MRVHGGISSFRVPEAFNQAMRQTMDSMVTPEWEAWWAPAGLGPLELTYSLSMWVDERVLMVRKTKDKVTAELKLPDTAVSDADDYPARARDEVARLLAKVRKRTGLGPHPEISPVEIDWATVHSMSSLHARSREVASAWPSDDSPSATT